MSAEADRGLLQGRAVKTIHHSSVVAKGRDRGPTGVRLTRLSGGPASGPQDSRYVGPRRPRLPRPTTNYNNTPGQREMRGHGAANVPQTQWPHNPLPHHGPETAWTLEAGGVETRILRAKAPPEVENSRPRPNQSDQTRGGI